MKKFVYEGNEYQIDDSRKVNCVGDFEERNKTIYVDKELPEKFHEGTAVHEIEERKLMKRGHSYVYSHNEAQKKERAFYEAKYGKGEGIKVLEEEERIVLKIAPGRLMASRAKKIVSSNIPAPEVQIGWVRQLGYEGKNYLLDNSMRLVGALADLYEQKGIIYIDQDVPERFFEGLAVYEIESRKKLKEGWSYIQAYNEAYKKKAALYETKFGKEMALKMLIDEEKLLAKKYFWEKKELGAGEGHKVIYGKGEILPR